MQKLCAEEFIHGAFDAPGSHRHASVEKEMSILVLLRHTRDAGFPRAEVVRTLMLMAEQGTILLVGETGQADSNILDATAVIKLLKDLPETRPLEKTKHVAVMSPRSELRRIYIRRIRREVIPPQRGSGTRGH